MTARRPAALKSALALGACLAGLAAAEIWVRLADPLPHLRAIVERREHPPAIGSEEEGKIATTLHPFLGWSRLPGSLSDLVSPDHAIFADGARPEDFEREAVINQLGHPSSIWDYRTVHEEDLVIGVFGGSVASHVAMVAGPELSSRVAQRAGLPDGSVVVLNFGAGAYKQPQQLIALNLAILLGIPLDVVVNLDGFNEIVFGRLNAAAGYHPLFPAKGQYSVAVQLWTALGSENALIRMGEIARARVAGDTAVERLLRSSALRRSELARTLAGAWASRHYERAQRLEAELQRTTLDSTLPSLAELSEPCIEEGRACYGPLGDIWQRSSELMHALSRSVGAHYVHALQPNQYLEGSKVLTPTELERAYDLDSHYAKHPPEGYRLLRIRGERLRRTGIDFHDLTMAFADVEESIYADRCCHYNAAGYRRIARAIGDLVADAMARRPTAPDREAP